MNGEPVSGPASNAGSISSAGSISPLRPLHLLESWPPVQTGYTTRSVALVGAQERLADLSPRVLVSSRQSVYGAATADPDAAGLDLGDRLRSVSVSARERRWRRLRPFAVDPGFLQAQLEAAVDELGADLIHCHWSSGIGRAAADAARRCGLPLVAEVRFDLAGAVTAQTARLPLSGARRVLEAGLRRHFERYLRRADAVVSASPSLAVLLQESVPGLHGRVRVAANGCEPDRFTPGPADPDLQRRWGLSDCLVVGTTATMLRYEGLDLLLTAAGRLRREHPELTVLLVGDGPERARLAEQAQRLGVRCVFTGRVPAEQMPAYYRLLDVLVVPRRDAAVTRYAGPVKLLEAMAAGQACLASAVGDISALLADGRGQVVAPGQVEALTDALDALLRDPGTRTTLGAAARRYSLDAGSWDAAARVHREVYADVTRRPVSAGPAIVSRDEF